MHMLVQYAVVDSYHLKNYKVIYCMIKRIDSTVQHDNMAHCP